MKCVPKGCLLLLPLLLGTLPDPASSTKQVSQVSSGSAVGMGWSSGNRPSKRLPHSRPLPPPPSPSPLQPTTTTTTTTSATHYQRPLSSERAARAKRTVTRAHRRHLTTDQQQRRVRSSHRTTLLQTKSLRSLGRSAADRREKKNRGLIKTGKKNRLKSGTRPAASGDTARATYVIRSIPNTDEQARLREAPYLSRSFVGTNDQGHTFRHYGDFDHRHEESDATQRSRASRQTGIITPDTIVKDGQIFHRHDGGEESKVINRGQRSRRRHARPVDQLSLFDEAPQRDGYDGGQTDGHDLGGYFTAEALNSGGQSHTRVAGNVRGVDGSAVTLRGKQLTQASVTLGENPSSRAQITDHRGDIDPVLASTVGSGKQSGAADARARDPDAATTHAQIEFSPAGLNENDLGEHGTASAVATLNGGSTLATLGGQTNHGSYLGTAHSSTLQAPPYNAHHAETQSSSGSETTKRLSGEKEGNGQVEMSDMVSSIMETVHQPHMLPEVAALPPPPQHLIPQGTKFVPASEGMVGGSGVPPQESEIGRVPQHLHEEQEGGGWHVVPQAAGQVGIATYFQGELGAPPNGTDLGDPPSVEYRYDPPSYYDTEYRTNYQTPYLDLDQKIFRVEPLELDLDTLYPTPAPPLPRPQPDFASRSPIVVHQLQTTTPDMPLHPSLPPNGDYSHTPDEPHIPDYSQTPGRIPDFSLTPDQLHIPDLPKIHSNFDTAAQQHIPEHPYISDPLSVRVIPSHPHSTDKSNVPDYSHIPDQPHIPDYTQAPDSIPDYFQAQDHIPDYSQAPDYIPDYSQTPDHIPNYSQTPNHIPDYSQAPDRIPDYPKTPYTISDYSQTSYRITDNSQTPDRITDYSTTPNRTTEHSQTPDRIPDYSQTPDHILDYSQTPDHIPDYSQTPDHIPDYSQTPDHIPDYSQTPDHIPDYSQTPDHIPDYSQTPDPIPEYSQTPDHIPHYSQSSDRIPDKFQTLNQPHIRDYSYSPDYSRTPDHIPPYSHTPDQHISGYSQTPEQPDQSQSQTPDHHTPDQPSVPYSFPGSQPHTSGSLPTRGQHTPIQSPILNQPIRPHTQTSSQREASQPPTSKSSGTHVSGVEAGDRFSGEAVEATPMPMGVPLVPGQPGSTQTLPNGEDGPTLNVITMGANHRMNTSLLWQRPGVPIQPGEKIPGAPGYRVPAGFRGRVILGHSLPVEASSRHVVEGFNTRVHLTPQSPASNTVFASVSGPQASQHLTSEGGVPGVHVTLGGGGGLHQQYHQASAPHASSDSTGHHTDRGRETSRRVDQQYRTDHRPSSTSQPPGHTRPSSRSQSGATHESSWQSGRSRPSTASKDCCSTISRSRGPTSLPSKSWGKSWGGRQAPQQHKRARCGYVTIKCIVVVNNAGHRRKCQPSYKTRDCCC